MAWYDTNKNGGHKVYGRPEPGYPQSRYPDHKHHPVILDSKESDGGTHEIIGYAEYQNAQSYMTEQIVELRHGGRGNGLGGLAAPDLTARVNDAYKHQGAGNKAYPSPWKDTTDWSESGYESSPKAHNQGAVYEYEKAKGGSPHYNNAYNNKQNNFNPRYGHNSPHPYSKPQYSSDDYSDDASDDEVRYNGVSYPNPKVGGNDYPVAPHSYGVPIAAQSGKDPYYGKPRKDNTAYSPPSYEATHNRPVSSNSPPIKTKPDYTTKQPKFNGSPKKPSGHTPTIDSSEAERRYGGVNLTEKQKPSRTIDCKAAAEKYRGVLMQGF